MWLLGKNERAVNQDVVSKNCFHHVQQRFVRDHLVRPVEKQMQTIEPLRREVSTVFNQRFKSSSKRRDLSSGKHVDRKQKPVAFIIFELLL